MKHSKILIVSIIVILIIIIIIVAVLANLLNNKESKTSSNAPLVSVVDDKAHATELYQNYKNNMINNPEEIYNHLEEEYKQKRFSTKEKFYKFIEETKLYVEVGTMAKYSKTEKTDYIQYEIYDRSGIYVCVREKTSDDYTLILDNHTVESDEDVEKYNNATTEQKVRINAEKILDAISTYDYEYVYDKLDSNFKKNNFDTLEKFEEYAKENLYIGVSSTDVNSAEYSEGQNIYILKMGADYSLFTIEMKLLEDSDFVMIFKAETFLPAEEE